RWTERAGETERIRVLEGEARELLPDLDPDAFDLVFIDADKEGYALYLEHAVRVLRPGGIVLADNALWRGRVADSEVDDAPTRGVRAFNRALASHPALASTILPVGDGVAVGVKG
ncbi:MAG: methyltransferase, partial [Gemmatimonadetes bacterium]|nr:methyltransferase [Gemmatimonadota bacterium]NIR80228.1 methyltransferase [Gemmatimonadota bacterium]NIT86757.1 methyltransferase [Gemmatimonadota bacterium]NIU30625.1 methyltransferase [Gemmatimonadota bacterium]NIU35433.1 methyltransferase [Gemmatimonadota bacterium]